MKAFQIIEYRAHPNFDDSNSVFVLPDDVQYAQANINDIDSDLLALVFTWNPGTGSYIPRGGYTEYPTAEDLNDYLIDLKLRANTEVTDKIEINPRAQSFGLFGDLASFFNIPILSDLLDFIDKNRFLVLAAAAGLLITRFKSK